MRKNICCGATVLLILIGGCSSEQSIKNLSADAPSPPAVPLHVQDPPVFSTLPQPITEEVLVSNDSLIAYHLEQTRQHYLSALSADENNDSLRATSQFEEAIRILNELSYYPQIEGSQDFNDLSKTVVEEYERYIRRSGIVDSTSSIFALREKLNQISEQVDTARVTLPTRTVITGTTIPLVVNGLVDKHISFFLGRGRVHMERWLQRSGKYFPLLKKIMREEGVPEEMVYLAMIESGLSNSARSWARAVGMWQFMRGTGKLYGLKGNFWWDDRRDFEKATRAAARHLRDLYEDFEDWYLVMAAYNSGPGNVYRAMRRSGSSDFWEMRRYLPRETRNYVPSYISAAIIAMNPEEYGFGHVQPDDSLQYETVEVNDCVDLEVLAECAGTDVETLVDLNPELIHRCTPPVTEGYTLRVPRGTDKEIFQQKYALIPEQEKGYLLTHIVRRGETVASLAKRYGVAQRVLAEANEISTRKRLSRGMKLVIPIANIRGAKAPSSLVSAGESRVREVATVRTQSRTVHARTVDYPDRTKVVYRIKSGDTIGHIAEWFGVRATDIRNWNNLPYGRKIVAGSILNLWVNKSDAPQLARLNTMTFAEKNSLRNKETSPAKQESPDDAFSVLVRAGDSLDKIARENGVTAKQIQRWNKLSSSRIVAGQKLVLYPNITEVETPQAKAVAEKLARSEGKTKQIIYVVRKGDTISRIAQDHAVEEKLLREWNSLNRKGKIYAGQELIIHKDAH